MGLELKTTSEWIYFTMRLHLENHCLISNNENWHIIPPAKTPHSYSPFSFKLSLFWTFRFVDSVLWFAISKSAIFKDKYFSMTFSFNFAYVGYGKLQWINNHMTFGLRPDFTDLTVDNWGTLQTVLLCSSVKSIVVLHNSTAVLME